MFCYDLRSSGIRQIRNSFDMKQKLSQILADIQSKTLKIDASFKCDYCHFCHSDLSEYQAHACDYSDKNCDDSDYHYNSNEEAIDQDCDTGEQSSDNTEEADDIENGDSNCDKGDNSKIYFCDQCDFSTKYFKGLILHNARLHLDRQNKKRKEGKLGIRKPKLMPKSIKLKSVKSRKLKTLLKSMHYHQTQIQIKSRDLKQENGQNVKVKIESYEALQENPLSIANVTTLTKQEFWQEPEAFNCDKCDKIFSSDMDVAEHKLLCHSFECHVCHVACHTSGRLAFHLKSKHDLIPKKNFKKSENQMLNYRSQPRYPWERDGR